MLTKEEIIAVLDAELERQRSANRDDAHSLDFYVAVETCPDGDLVEQSSTLRRADGVIDLAALADAILARS